MAHFARIFVYILFKKEEYIVIIDLDAWATINMQSFCAIVRHACFKSACTSWSLVWEKCGVVIQGKIILCVRLRPLRSWALIGEVTLYDTDLFQDGLVLCNLYHRWDLTISGIHIPPLFPDFPYKIAQIHFWNAWEPVKMVKKVELLLLIFCVLIQPGVRLILAVIDPSLYI